MKPLHKQITVAPRCGEIVSDAIVLLVLAGTILSVFACHLAKMRQQARSVQCQDRLQSIGIAIHSYHQSLKALPTHGWGTFDQASGMPDLGDAGTDGVGGTGGGDNGKSLSMLVAILPQLNQQSLWESITQPSSATTSGKLGNGSTWNSMGPGPAQREYKPWSIDLPEFRCPSDQRKNAEITGRTNYAACLGDALDYQTESAVRFDLKNGAWAFDPAAKKRIEAAARGPFVFRESMKLSDVTDGLSNTALMAEIVTHAGDLDTRTRTALGFGDQDSGSPPQGGIFDSAFAAMQSVDPERPRYWIGKPAGKFSQPPKMTERADENRGLRWADAHTVFSGFTTIGPPNFPLQVEGDLVTGAAVAPPSSWHPGGAHVLFCDGATHFITDSIDAGDLHGGSVRHGMAGKLAPGSKSPFGTWGAMGTRASKD